MPNQTIQPAKLPGTTKNYTWDFLSDLAPGETISSQSVAASVYSGTDSSPSAIINGAATASGSVVTQSLTGGVAGVLYMLVAEAITSTNQILQQFSLLAITPPIP